MSIFKEMNTTSNTCDEALNHLQSHHDVDLKKPLSKQNHLRK